MKKVSKTCNNCGAKHGSLATDICVDCRLAAEPFRPCMDCGQPFKNMNHQSRTCFACSKANWHYSKYGSGRYLAARAVALARKNGLLAPPQESPCADCGAVATEYDHRDYDYPLAVQPVCRGCNRRRGRAKRKSWTFGEFYAWFQEHAAQRKRWHLQIDPMPVEAWSAVRRKHWPEENTA